MNYFIYTLHFVRFFAERKNLLYGNLKLYNEFLISDWVVVSTFPFSAVDRNLCMSLLYI